MNNWQPFASLIKPNKIIKELQNKRNQKQLPTLSEDELTEIETKIQKAYHTHEKIKITYFFNHQYYTKLGTIKSINLIEKQINFEDNTTLYFEQILKINFTF